MAEHKILLQGIVGSHAYGLNRAGSDIDRLAVFVAPTVDVAGLDWHRTKETVANQGPVHDDFAMHEIGKMCRLLLAGNPTVNELLWLDSYEIDSDFGRYLLDIRTAFLSRSAILHSYLGYANAQIERFKSSGISKPKYARHALRLIEQGHLAYTTGSISVRVSDPEFYWDFETWAPDAILAHLEDARNGLAGSQRGVLPDNPDHAAIRTFLREVRIEFLEG